MAMGDDEPQPDVFDIQAMAMRQQAKWQRMMIASLAVLIEREGGRVVISEADMNRMVKEYVLCDGHPPDGDVTKMRFQLISRERAAELSDKDIPLRFIG